MYLRITSAVTSSPTVLLGFYTNTYKYDSLEQLRSHLHDFVMVYNFAIKLNSLKLVTPYEKVIEEWMKNPKNFHKNPNHFLVGRHNFLISLTSE